MAAIVNAGTKLGQGIIKASTPFLKNCVKYGKVEFAPPGPSEWGKAAAEGGQIFQSLVTGRFLQQTVREAMVTAVLVADVTFCFYIGEVIGKGNLIGYKIPGAHIDCPKKVVEIDCE